MGEYRYPILLTENSIDSGKSFEMLSSCGLQTNGVNILDSPIIAWISFYTTISDGKVERDLWKVSEPDHSSRLLYTSLLPDDGMPDFLSYTTVGNNLDVIGLNISEETFNPDPCQIEYTESIAYLHKQVRCYLLYRDSNSLLEPYQSIINGNRNSFSAYLESISDKSR